MLQVNLKVFGGVYDTVMVLNFKESLTNAGKHWDMSAVMKAQGKLTYLPHTLELLFVLLLAWVVSGWWIAEDIDGRGIAYEPMHLEEKLPSNVKPLMHVALFGAEQKGRVVTKKMVVAPVVESRLNMQLLGTVVAAERSAAVVLLQGSRKQQVFFIGEMIQPGVVLDGVEVAAIIVNHDGKAERIALQKSNVGSVVNSSSTTRQGASLERVLQRSHLQKEMRDLPRLFSQARGVPHLNQGRVDGFMVTAIVPGSL